MIKTIKYFAFPLLCWAVVQSPVHTSSLESEWYDCSIAADSQRQTDWCDRLEMLQNGSFRLPDSSEHITLSAGRYESDSQQIQLINRPGLIHFGDVDADGREDAVFLLAVDLGSGQFTYLTTVLDVDAVDPSEPLPMGNSMEFDLLVIESGRVTVIFSQNQSLVQTQSATSPSQGATNPFDTIAFFETETHAVRVFNRNGQARLNMYNKGSRVLEINAEPVELQRTRRGVNFLHRGRRFTYRIFVPNEGVPLFWRNGELLRSGDVGAGLD